MADETKVVSMKLLIDTKANRVLFAEVGKDCVDFLFQILSLPVATVVRLLQGQGMEGSWPNLYQSIQDLNHTYIQLGKNKDSLLNPAAPSSVPLLDLKSYNKAQIPDDTFYRCSNCKCDNISKDSTATCRSCFYRMTTKLTVVGSFTVPPPSQGGGLVKEVVTYMVMDDLVVKPMSTISSIALLNTFNVKDISTLEEKEVNFGMKEAIKLLKASHHSKNVLTDVFC